MSFITARQGWVEQKDVEFGAKGLSTWMYCLLFNTFLLKDCLQKQAKREYLKPFQDNIVQNV
jgi:hypothetical protein